MRACSAKGALDDYSDRTRVFLYLEPILRRPHLKWTQILFLLLKYCSFQFLTTPSKLEPLFMNQCTFILLALFPGPPDIPSEDTANRILLPLYYSPRTPLRYCKSSFLASTIILCILTCKSGLTIHLLSQLCLRDLDIWP